MPPSNPPTHPYLLRDLAITRPDQVWAMGTTKISVRRRDVHLAAVIDWFSRRVLAWRLSRALDTRLCLDTIEAALAQHGPPDILNIGRHVPFACAAFTEPLEARGLTLSMVSSSPMRDNPIVVRLWYSVKYERNTWEPYPSLAAAQEQLQEYFTFYNGKRPHSSLESQRPDDVYYHKVSSRQHDPS